MICTVACLACFFGLDGVVVSSVMPLSHVLQHLQRDCDIRKWLLVHLRVIMYSVWRSR